MRIPRNVRKNVGGQIVSWESGKLCRYN